MFKQTLLPLLTMALLSASSLTAQENVISVLGSATIEVPTDKIELVVKLNGSAKTVADAIENFVEKKQKFIDKLNPMDFPGVEFEFQGQVVGKNGANGGDVFQGMAFPVGGDAAAPELDIPFSVSESVNITLDYDTKKFAEAMNKVSKLIVALEGIEVQVGGGLNQLANIYGVDSGSLISATVNDRASVEKKAITKAMQDARSKAETLAELAGVELGKIVGIEEADEALDDSNEYLQALGYSADGSSGETIRSIKVSKMLKVRFAIQ